MLCSFDTQFKNPRVRLIGWLRAFGKRRVHLYVHASIVICAVLACNLGGNIPSACSQIAGAHRWVHGARDGQVCQNTMTMTAQDSTQWHAVAKRLSASISHHYVCPPFSDSNFLPGLKPAVGAVYLRLQTMGAWCQGCASM